MIDNTHLLSQKFCESKFQQQLGGVFCKHFNSSQCQPIHSFLECGSFPRLLWLVTDRIQFLTMVSYSSVPSSSSSFSITFFLLKNRATDREFFYLLAHSHKWLQEPAPDYIKTGTRTSVLVYHMGARGPSTWAIFHYFFQTL